MEWLAKLLLFMILSVVSLVPGAPSNHSSCQVNLSACIDYIPGSGLNLTTCCRQLIAIAANKDQTVSLALDCEMKLDAVDLCYDGSRVTTSPTESLHRKFATSKRSLSEFCTDCKEGDYNLSSAKLPPAKPPGT